ncbi:MAG: glycosyltransferase family 2 protein [Crocinitomicaceae bacterium]|nr:glycosyltransferase family 2 protein [Crocinitomicaceae bacterium]
MPVKNAGKYLHQCLDSIISQSFTNWELIAVDDGSTDNTIDILGDFEDRDLRIKVLNNRGDGIIDALHLAFENSSGAYITRMDADDIMPLNKLEKLYHHLANRRKVVITGRVRYFSDKKVSEGYRRYEDWLNEIIVENTFSENMYRECVVASPNWMVHRSCFEQDISMDSLVYPEDYDMVFQWIKHGYSIESTNHTTHLWREHEERTSRNSDHYQQPAFFRLKTTRFIENFSDQIQGVQLIGKGQKGKLIAAVLRDHQVDFEWFDLQPTKGLKSVLDLEKRLSILSNWPVDVKTQRDITSFLRNKNLKFGEDLWLF